MTPATFREPRSHTKDVPGQGRVGPGLQGPPDQAGPGRVSCHRPLAGPRVAVVVEQLWQDVPGGSGTYIVELTRALRAGGARLAGIAARHSSDPVGLSLPSLPLQFSRLPRRLLYDSWNYLGRPLAEAALPGAQVVHATTWAVPGTHLPLVVTVHDLAFLRSPEHFTARGNRYFQRSLARVRAGADVVIAPSRATAEDCVDAGIASKRVHVVPHGVRTRPVTDAEVTAFRDAHDLGGEYVLWTGTHEPRKNLSGVLGAFRLLSRAHPEVDLVLVGPAGWGDDSQEQRLVADLGGRVHVLGRLGDADLAAAYRGARAFVFPSLWEGFGLPVLEAMAYGTPVVTSRGTCMEEVCGRAGLLAEATDPEEIAARLGDAVGPAHDELAQAGLERAATFTWEACAAAHAEVYASLV